MNHAYSKLKAALVHDLSPAPVFGLFLGFWLPLEFMCFSANLAGIPLVQKVYIIAAAAVFNFGLAACVMAALVYLAAGIASLFGVAYARAVRFGMASSAWVVFLVVCTITVRHTVLPPFGLSILTRMVILGGCAAIAITLALKGYQPGRILGLPFGLGVCLVPTALILVACEWAGVGLPSPLRGAKPAPGRPDILFITLDALSARHLTMYGYPRPTSPNLQAFADGAITLDHFYANSNWTRPGIATLLNGVRPWTHRGDVGALDPKVVETRNLVRQLVLAGYDARCVATNLFAGPFSQDLLGVFRQEKVELVFPALNYGLVWSQLPSISGQAAAALGPVPRILSIVQILSWKQFPDKTQAPVAAAESLFRNATDRPQFVWLHLLTAHDPYAAPKPFMGSLEPSPLAREMRKTFATYGFLAAQDPCFPNIYQGRYDEAIMCMDAGLGQLFDWLKAQGRFERTLIVVTADHGESFTHGYGGHGGPLLSEDLLWIPCLIKPPFHHGPERDSRLFEQVDLEPTMLQMVGLPEPRGLEGVAMARKPEGLPVFSMNHDYQLLSRSFSVAVRLGNWKYVEHFGHWTFPWPKRELYDLAVDPAEDHNLAEIQPDRATALRGLILAELAKRKLKPDAG